MRDDRRLVLFCAVLVVAAAGCDARIGARQESDAELACRQGGFFLGSTAYDHCVEDFSQRTTDPGSTQVASLDAGAKVDASVPAAQGVTAQPDSEGEAARDDGDLPEYFGAELAKGSPADGFAGQEPRGEAVAVAHESFVAHLSSVKSEVGTRTEWRRLQALFPQQLSEVDLTVRTIQIAEQGTFYRVMAGPFEARGQADTLCTELEPHKQYCQVYPLASDPAQ